MGVPPGGLLAKVLSFLRSPQWAPGFIPSTGLKQKRKNPHRRRWDATPRSSNKKVFLKITWL